MDLTFKEINSIEQFDQMEAEWTQLLEQCPHLSFFLSWKWLNLWWHTFATNNDTLKIIVVEQKNTIIALLPLYLQNKQTLRFIGTGEPEQDEVATEYIDLICLKHNTKSIIAPLADHILTISAQSIEFNNYLESSDIALLINNLSNFHWENTALCGVRYWTDLTEGTKVIDEKLDQSLIKRLKRAKRKFENSLEGKVNYAANQKKFPAGFETLKNLHNKRWQGKDKSGAFSSDKFALFHDHFCQYAMKKGWLQLNILSVEQRPISAIYCIDYQSTTYFYQSGVDDMFKPNISPGYLIHLLQMEQSIKQKNSAYDFMKGEIQGSYKSKLSNQENNMYNTTLLKKTIINRFRMLILQLKKIKGQCING